MKARHGLIAFLIALAALMAAPFAVAQPAGPDPAVTAAPVVVDADAAVATPVVVNVGAVTAGPARADKEVTVEELAEQAQKIQEDWERLGWMGGTIALIGLLLLALRYGPIDDLLGEHDLKRFKPLIAAGLGVLLGFLQTFITGKGWATSIVAGLIAGIATPGLHQLFTKANTK